MVLVPSWFRMTRPATIPRVALGASFHQSWMFVEIAVFLLFKGKERRNFVTVLIQQLQVQDSPTAEQQLQPAGRHVGLSCIARRQLQVSDAMIHYLVLWQCKRHEDVALLADPLRVLQKAKLGITQLHK